MARPQLEVVHVGSACRDLTPDDPRGWRLGGGVTYAALATARLGLRTAALIGVDEVSADATEFDLLRRAGVDIVLDRLAEAPIFDNRETRTGRVQTCHAIGQPLRPRELPPGWVAAQAWSIVPVAGEIDDSWAAVIPASTFLAIGWQGFLRDLTAGERVARRAPGPSELLGRADLVGVSHHDVGSGTSIATLAGLLQPGADLLVTEGDAGGLLIHVGDEGPAEVLRYLPTATDREVDPTGAGDTFLAALLASVLRPAIVGRRRSRRSPDLRFAAAAGSLAVEGPGLSGVPDRAAVLVRRARERVRRAVLPSEVSQVGAADPS
ncbi:MAG TPA: PfkB family carbohydrate kinase [Candidatus Limnocylindrales bacterium]